jgi:Ca2+-binding RTX toxin-like protein
LSLLTLLLLLAAPVAANAANVTVSGGTLTYTAGAGETNTAVIVKQTTTAIATVYFVGDQNPAVTVTASAAQGCVPTAPALGLPAGYLCTVPAVTPVTSLVENLGDRNDTGVIGSAASGPRGTINGGTGDDTLVGGRQNDTFTGGSGTDSVAYVGIADATITRTAPVTAALPTGASPSTGNGQSGENDSIATDIEGLTGGNGNDTLTGNGGPNTIAGSAPPGTPSVDPQPAGTESRDTVSGGGGDDTLLAGDSGTVNGQDGNDTIVGGRSFANLTNVNGGNDDDTLVSGLGNDNIAGNGGSNTLAYVSVSQGGLKIVDRGTNGVTARLPEPGTTATGGRTGGPEQDIIHDDIGTLIGSNGNDALFGADQKDDQILGAAPVGTGSGVVDTPAGNDSIYGRGGEDSLVGGDRGQILGGADNDTIVGGRSTASGDKTLIRGDNGDDTIVSGPGNDEILGGNGSNTLAYASVSQQGVDIVDRGTSGVTVRLPDPGATGTGGKTGGPERDIIHDDVHTVIGSNNNDSITGSNGPETILGAAPVGTGSGVVDSPAGNDTIVGLGGDDSIVAGDRGLILGNEGNDTLVGGRSTASGAKTVIHGYNGDDTIVSGPGNDEIFGDTGNNTLAYASVNQQGVDIVKRTGGVLAVLPGPGATGQGGTIGGGEKDVIHDDVHTLIGSNYSDFLIGSVGVDTILGAAPVGTGSGVVDSPAGNDWILGLDDADTLVAGDSGIVSGGDGDDSIVGGRSTASGVKTVIHGDIGNDTIVSGLGNDEIFGDQGSNILAYASVNQQGIDIIDRGTNGVTASLANPGQTASGGRTGGAEKDVIHDDIGTLVGSNGNDILAGNDGANNILGVAPAGTAGVKPGPAGNDVLIGGAGFDIMFGAEGNDWLLGGADTDVMLAAGGNDLLAGQAGVDNFNAGDGDDRNFARDGGPDSITCGLGNDSLDADLVDATPANDCESVTR